MAVLIIRGEWGAQMGIFRFFLAMLVVLAHIPGHHQGFNFAASAVISFYFISGYLVTLSYMRFKGSGFHQATIGFLVDRVMRLYPIYILCCGIMLFISTFNGKPLNWENITQNLYILPLAYSYPPFSISAILPPLWSLGVEFHFYLFLPLFLLLKKWIQLLIVVTMVTGHIMAFFLTKQTVWYSDSWGISSLAGILMPASEFFGYRFAFFSGAVFLLGSWAAYHRDWRITGGGIFAYILLFFIFGQAGWAVGNTYVFDVLFGVIVFIPFAIALLHVQFNGFLKRLDYWLGTLSWPIFACHWIGIELALSYFPSNTVWRFVVVFCITILLSILLARFQAAVDRYRYGFRGFGKLALAK